MKMSYCLEYMPLLLLLLLRVPSQDSNILKGVVSHINGQIIGSSVFRTEIGFGVINMLGYAFNFLPLLV